jgi:superfamily II DNA/RNA helicase
MTSFELFMRHDRPIMLSTDALAFGIDINQLKLVSTYVQVFAHMQDNTCTGDPI